jgi:3-oxoacyl-[acyl-carrier-protein] synthase-3
MVERIPVGIAGTGCYLPERVVRNDHFAKFLDTSDEWITQRTGIRERRFAAEHEATSDLSLIAAGRALEMAGVTAKDLDLIVLGTLTPDMLLPATACFVQERLGASRAGAFDVNAACTGFLTALHAGEAFIASGRARCVLAIGAEVLSRFLDWKDRGSCILFGDAAGAAVLRPHSECGRGEILKTSLGADGSGAEFIHMVGGGTRVPPTHESIDRGDHFIRLKGREVYRFAVTKMSELIAEMASGHDPADVALIVPHQVNARIIQAATERLGWSEDKVVINIDRYGNTSAATVPVALDEAVRAGRLLPGKLVILVAFGAGLTWGATLLRW